MLLLIPTRTAGDGWSRLLACSGRGSGLRVSSLGSFYVSPLLLWPVPEVGESLAFSGLSFPICKITSLALWAPELPCFPSHSVMIWHRFFQVPKCLSLKKHVHRPLESGVFVVNCQALLFPWVWTGPNWKLGRKRSPVCITGKASEARRKQKIITLSFSPSGW